MKIQTSCKTESEILVELLQVFLKKYKVIQSMCQYVLK